MIQFSLKCDKGHAFDSWFQSAEAYEKLARSGHVSCAICGSDDVTKAVMAPRVSTSRAKTTETDLAKPTSDAEKALAQLKQHIETNSDYVGGNFASEARAMHLGDVPTRAIHGEAKPDEAKALIEEGVPVAPLPFVPNRKTN